MSDIVLGVRLTADGKELVGTANVSTEAMKKLRGEVDANADSARKLTEQQKNLGSAATSAREALARHVAELGGNETASRALYATVMRLGAGFGAAALAVAALTAAYVEGAREAREMNSALTLTSNYAGTTRGQMRELAQSISDAGQMTIATSKGIVTQLVGSGRIGAEALTSVARLAEDYAKATGRQAKEIAPELVKLFSDPAKGAEQLNQQYHALSVAQLEHIAQLQRMGEMGKAQLEAVNLLAPVMAKGRVELGSLETAWDSVQKAASKAWDAMLGVGRPKSLEEQVQEQRRNVLALQTQRGVNPAVLRAAIDREGDLLSQAAGAAAAAGAQGEQAAANARAQQAQALAQQTAAYKLRVVRDQRVIADAIENPTERAQAHALLDKQEQELQFGKPKAATGQDMEAYLVNLRKRVELTKESSAEEKILADLDQNIWKNATPEREKEIKDLARKALYQEQQKLALAADLEQGRQEAAVEEARVALAERAQAAREQALGSARAALDVGNDELALAQTEVSMMGRSEAERHLVIASLRAEYEARRDIKALGLEGEQAEQFMANRRSAAEARATAENMRTAAQEQKRFWDGIANDINRSLTDSIMRGFESGQSFAKNFGESLKRYFLSLAISIPIRFVSNAVTGTLASAFPGAAAAFSGNGNGGGFNVSNLSSLTNFSQAGLTNALGASEVLSAGGGFGGAASTLFGGNAGLAAAGGAMDMGIGFGGSTMAALGMEGAAAGGAAALGAGAAAAIPYVGWAAAAIMAAKSLFGGKKTPAVFTNYDAPALTFGAGGLTGTIYGNDQKGDRWAGEQFTGQWADSAQSQYGYFEQIGKRLGLDTSGLRGVSANFNGGAFTTHAEMLQPAIDALANQLGHTLMPNLDQFAKSGETAAQTLLRLAEEADGAATALNDAQKKIIADFNAQAIGNVDNIRFGTSLLGMSSNEQELATADRQLRQQYEQALTGLTGDSIAQLDQAYALRKAELDLAIQEKQAREAALAAEAQQLALMKEQYGNITGRMSAALGLGDSMRDLWLSNISPLTASERLQQAMSVADQYAASARGGDITAFANYGNAARGYLSEASTFYGTSTTAYRNLFEARQREAGGIIGGALDQGVLDFKALGVPLGEIAGNTGELVPLLRQLLEETRTSNDALRLFALSRDSATFL